MTSDDRKAWDARLVEWMQRGSSTAKSTAWTPKTRVAYAVIWLVAAVISGSALFYVLAGWLVLVSLVLAVCEYRQHARQE
jgi:CHASE2 domain-containing sensor protein